MRLFVAIAASEDAREAIAAEQKRIAAALGGMKTSLHPNAAAALGTPLKWVKPEHAVRCRLQRADAC